MLLGPPLSLRKIRRAIFFVAARFIEAKRPCQERARQKSGTLRKSMIFHVVEISFDGWEKRRLVVPNAAGGRLAVHEARVAPLAFDLVRVALSSEPHRDDVPVGVAVLHGRILGHEDGPHGLAC